MNSAIIITTIPAMISTVTVSSEPFPDPETSAGATKKKKKNSMQQRENRARLTHKGAGQGASKFGENFGFAECKLIW